MGDNLPVHPGFEVRTRGRTVAGGVKSTAISTADFGSEWFDSDRFSQSASYGVEFRPVSGIEDDWGLAGLRDYGFDSAGVHFCFQ